MKRRVVVTGLGVMTAAGCDLESFWAAALDGTPCVTPLRAMPDHQPAVAMAAQVPDDRLEAMAKRPSLRKADRFVRLGALAAEQALVHAELPSMAPPERAGVIMGSGLGGVLFHEEQMWRVISSGEVRVHPHSVPRITPTAVVAEIAIAHGLRGPGYVVASACASGAHAIGQAMRLIAHGEADVVVAGGADAPLTPFTVTAFSLLGVMTRTTCRPFDRARDGFVIGEGAAALVLESFEHAQARGARVLAEVRGFGQSLGAHHVVHTRPDGQDAAQAMRLALADAGLGPGDIGWINAHGTATVENDRTEVAAIRQVFGEDISHVPLSSTKHLVGHTLGASGAIEAVLACLALDRGTLPPTPTTTQPEQGLDVVTTARPAQPRAVLSNSFGFGNMNASLVLAHPNPAADSYSGGHT